MKLTIPLHIFLTNEKVSVRLFNMLSRDIRPGSKSPTLSQFIDQWPLERLRKEVFGFGPKAQAELLDILTRHNSCKTGRRYADYCASLKQLDCSPEHLRKLSLLRLLQQLVEVTKNTRSTRLQNIITELKKRPVESLPRTYPSPPPTKY